MENSTSGESQGTAEKSDERTIYLAGGCFWGIEHLMRALSGVSSTTVGYANGTGPEDAVYERVCEGGTGFREAVQVTYDPSVTSPDALLFAYLAVIDPTKRNRQGNDVGEQYQAGVYWDPADAETAADVRRIMAIERSRTPGFAVEVKPLENFFAAEDYHQDYLVKNPGGYCHVPLALIGELSRSRIDPARYRRPDEEVIEASLTPKERAVSQESGTEPPFDNEYWSLEERGIYVDRVTGEPLFSSADKYRSSCGWPAFCAPLEPEVVVDRVDTSHGMVRTEVRSRAGDSHLGHVFKGDLESPTGVRYCMNSASLRFVPEERMEQEGYGYLLDTLD